MYMKLTMTHDKYGKHFGVEAPLHEHCTDAELVRAARKLRNAIDRSIARYKEEYEDNRP